MDTHTTGDVGNRTPTTADILEGLNDLLQLDHDAIGAYDIAIERLADRDHADQIAGFRRDHERHIQELNQLITGLGGTPVNQPHATGPFKQALQGLGALAGDKGILMSWRVNELQVRTKYDAYASKAVFWPNDVKRAIDRNALDEERHYEWVSRVLGSTGESGAGIAGNVRERVVGGARQAANRIGHLMGQGEGGGGLSGVTDRLSDVTRSVREVDFDQMRGGFEDRVRSKPVQTLLVAALAGFVVGRILR